MSGTSSGTSTGPDPDGRGSHSGGGGGPPNTVAGGNNAGVTNQTLLALDPSTFQHLHHHQVRALNVVQLEFARDVANRTAQAYQQTLDVLGRQGNPSVSGG